MIELEKKIDILEPTTPYTRTDEEIRALLDSVVTEAGLLFVDKTTNPDIGDFSVYKLVGTDPRADIGRTLEAQIFNQDADYPPEFIQENFEPHDDNSIFLVLVTDDQQAVGVLRVINCIDGNSETQNMFHEFFGEETTLPSELQLPKDGSPLWDILTVVMKHEYRNGENSAWLYHALYQMSQQEDVEHWIANITPKEMRNLREYIGIPFREIPGVGEVTDKSPVTGKESVYGFYTIDVSSIEPSVLQNIASIEEKITTESESDLIEISRLFSKIAKIALLGKTE